MTEFADYIGIKRIKAKVATWAEAQAVLNRPVSEKDPAPDTLGYLTQDTDGYLSWSPKDTFDGTHFKYGEYCDTNEPHFENGKYYAAVDDTQLLCLMKLNK